ncbi:MAG: T9SS type A sorting domain-containing protein [Chitinophagales bacterium]
MNPENDNEVLITYSNYGIINVYHTTNANAASPTWTNVEGSTTAVQLASIRSSSIVKGATSTYYLIGTSTGLYCTSTLSGATTVWERVVNDIGYAVTSHIRLRASDNTLVAGTHGNGMFQLVLVTPTCTDGIQNGDETGVDCGGSCPTACPTCTDGIQNGDETGVDCGGSCPTACPTCTDGIQNGDETGVDCGGSCPTACPTCTDGIQNGDETGVDCGGSCPTACPTCSDGLQNGDETGVDCGGSCPTACPTCSDGLQNGDETGVDCGGSCPTACPTCSDGLQNGDETGIDCGGSCPTACPTCSDGIQNGDETGIDCGGSCPTACPTCSDGIQNGDETGVDCGGSCPTACPTCSDGLQNGDETGIDCGGSCPTACPTCSDGVQNGDETGVDCGGSCPTACPTCSDGVQNGDETGVDCGGSCPTACPTCSDGLQNGDETGVDCGGSCPTACPTCTDGIQNGDETGVDCGGSCPTACPTCTDGIQNGDETGVDCGGSCPTACATCTDGIQNGDETGVDCGGSCPTACPTCTDGIQNGDETGVDCGGSCPTACPTCTDGIQNGDETGVDCGGSCPTACPTCTDGIQNGDETGVDCGGSCPTACPTCTDGIQNGDETGVDCGGSCPTACPTCTDGIQNGDETGVDCGGSCPTACSTCTDGIQNGDETGVDCGGSCPTACATCTDGIQNGDETGVDCGGSCPTACPTCTDGIQNGDETGVDCGGSCPTACPTCSDGLQNGDETGVDCGGSCPTACPTCTDGIQNGDETGVDCGGSCPTACATCTDGIQNGDETGVDCGGSCPTACPTCSDGLQNGDETGVDCGGSCPTACPTCTDGIQNGDETGVDCGGSCPTACPTCTDGIQNGDETGVDCGGSCPTACPTCTDGIQNGDETGVDCGGSCPTACPTCTDGIQNGDETGVDCGGSCPNVCSTGNYIDLELTKTVDNSLLVKFTNRTFTISVTNKGTVIATGVSVKDKIPTGMAFTSATVSKGSYVLFSETWVVGTLAPNETATLTLKLFILNVNTAITNFAQVQSANETDVDSTPGNDTDNTPNEDDEAAATISPDVQPDKIDLELTKTANVSQAVAGNQVTYTLTLSNKGPATATGVSVKITPPVGVQYFSDNPSAGTYSNATKTWTVGTILNGQTKTLQLTVNVISIPNPIKCFSQVQTANESDVDSTPGNDTDQTPNEDDESSVTIIPTPTDSFIDLELTKTVNNTELVKFTHRTFTITVVNKGPMTATGVSVKDQIPTGQAFSGSTASKGSYSSWNGIWTIGTLAPNESVTLNITIFILTDSAPVVNFAQVQTANETDMDSSPGNDTDNTPNEDDEDNATIGANTQPDKIDLQLTKNVSQTEAEVGDFLTYSLVLLNKGSANATGVSVKDALPSGLSYIGSAASKGTYDSGTGIWTIGNLNSNSTATLTINVQVEQINAPITNFAQVQTANETDLDSTPGNDSNNTPNEDDEDDATVNPPTICDNVTDGGSIGSNETGCSPSFDPTMIVNAALPSGGTGALEYLWFKSTTGTPFTTASTDWFPIANTNSPNFDPSFISQTTYYIRCARRFGCEDYVGESNMVIKTVETCGGGNKIDLEVNVTVDKPFTTLYQNVTFTITVTNNSTLTATGVEVKNSIPGGMAFTSQSVSQGNFNLYFQKWNVGTLTGGSSATMNLVLFTLNLNNPVVNFAQVSAANETDLDSTPNNNITTTPIEDDEAVATVSLAGSSGGKGVIANAPVDRATTLVLYSISPVPASGDLTVLFHTEGFQVNVLMYDVSGKLLSRKSLQTARGDNSIHLDIRHLPTGFYTLSIETPEGYVRGKFVKE